MKNNILILTMIGLLAAASGCIAISKGYCGPAEKQVVYVESERQFYIVDTTKGEASKVPLADDDRCRKSENRHQNNDGK